MFKSNFIILLSYNIASDLNVKTTEVIKHIIRRNLINIEHDNTIDIKKNNKRIIMQKI